MYNIKGNGELEAFFQAKNINWNLLSIKQYENLISFWKDENNFTFCKRKSVDYAFDKELLLNVFIFNKTKIGEKAYGYYAESIMFDYHLDTSLFREYDSIIISTDYVYGFQWNEGLSDFYIFRL